MSEGKRLSAARAFTLVEILLVVVIICILALILLPRLTGGGKGGPGRPTPKSALAQANDSVCLQNLGSVRQCIMAARTGDPDGQNPPSLDSIRELSPDLKRCPVGGEPYVYDPQTGQVHCPHPGHENY